MIKKRPDVAKGKKQVVALNKWLRFSSILHVVRDTENPGELPGFRPKELHEVVWF